MKHKVCSLIIFLTFVITSSLNSSNYDDDILNIYAKISPRLILMSSQKKSIVDSLQICFVSDSEDKLPVDALIKKMKNNYPDGLRNIPIKFMHTTYTQASLCQNSQLAFLFNSHSKNIISFVKFAKKNTILTISYDNKMLNNGIDISLFLGRKIVPYLNMESITKKNIKLNNILLRISKIYSKQDEK